MKPEKYTSIIETIESRSPAGRHETVQGWHNLLKNLLAQMTPYLRPGHLITFKALSKHEGAFFEGLQESLRIPPPVCAVFLPPSVRFQMLYHRTEGEPQPIPDFSADNPPDEGVVLACRSHAIDVVINALLAKPPFTPAVDVYNNGQLLAGYLYHSIEECVEDLTRVVRIHLETETDVDPPQK